MRRLAEVLLAAEETARILASTSNNPKQLPPAYMRTDRSFRAQIDLTEARTDDPLGLEDWRLIYRWFTVELAEDDFTFKLKSPSGVMSEEFIGRQGAILAQHDFIEIWVSNSVGAGRAIIQVGWRE